MRHSVVVVVVHVLIAKGSAVETGIVLRIGRRVSIHRVGGIVQLIVGTGRRWSSRIASVRLLLRLIVSWTEVGRRHALPIEHVRVVTAHIRPILSLTTHTRFTLLRKSATTVVAARATDNVTDWIENNVTADVSLEKLR